MSRFGVKSGRVDVGMDVGTDEDARKDAGDPEGGGEEVGGEEVGRATFSPSSGMSTSCRLVCCDACLYKEGEKKRN